MSGVGDKASGLANETIGKIKQGIGTALGSNELKAKGAAQELKGQTQQTMRHAEAAAEETLSGAAPIDLEQSIRVRAYQLWEEEGRPDGRDQIHWEQAKSEIETTGGLR